MGASRGLCLEILTKPDVPMGLYPPYNTQVKAKRELRIEGSKYRAGSGEP